MKGLYLKDGWYYFQPPTPKGMLGKVKRPRAVALRTQDYLAAVTSALEIRDKTDVDHAKLRGTMSVVLPLYYEEKGLDRKTTRRGRLTVLEGMKEILGNPRVGDLNPELMTKWWDHLGKKGATPDGRGPCSPASKKSYLIVVKAFINWLKKRGYLKGDPLERLRRQSQVGGTRVHEFLSEDERDRLFVAQAAMPVLAGSRAGRKARMELILILGFYQGLRDQEMLAIHPGWLWMNDDCSAGTITVQDTDFLFTDGTKGTWCPKAKWKREIPMHPRLLEHFKEHGICSPWLIAPEKERWPTDEMTSKRFSAITTMRNLAKAAKVKKLNFHIMRHSFATHLSMRGVPIAVIAGLIGDRVSVTEDHYAGFSPTKVNPLVGL